MKNKIPSLVYAIIPVFVFVCGINAQETVSDELFERMLTTLLREDEMSQEQYSYLYELINELHDNPIDINSATTSQLLSIPFLSSEQVEDIEEYIYKNGPVLTLGELQFIGSLDYDTRRFLSCLVYPGPGNMKIPKTSFGDVLKYGRNTLLARTDIALYQRNGFAFHTADELRKYPNRAYRGNAFQGNMKYTFNWHDKVRFGFSVDKDAGEKIDFISAYMFLNDYGNLNCLAIGNIKASFGQGLVVNTGFSMGKNQMSGSMDRPLTGFKPHSSTSESGYFTGAGCTFALGRISISSLVSVTAVDATLSESGSISSLKDDGYHRTPLEFQKRHNTMESVALTHINWHGNGIDIGGTLLFDSFDRSFLKFEPQSTGSNLFLSGFWNASADYSVRRAGISLNGETAISGNGAVATVNILRMRLTESSNIMLIYRDYSPNYISFHSAGFSDGDIVNERGLYFRFGADISSVRLSAYTDLMRFPDSRQSASLPSYGFDTQMELEYSSKSGDELDFRYRFKARQQDCKSVAGDLSFKDSGRLRVKWNRTINGCASFDSQFSLSHCYFPDSGFELGYALSQSVSIKSAETRLSGTAALCYFNTRSNDTSLSIYEKGLLNGFNFITLTGQGLRYSAIARYDITGNIMIMLKFSGTLYFDRQSIGSSQQRIDQNHKEDINVQCRIKF